jgi:hypothetical protein
MTLEILVLPAFYTFGMWCFMRGLEITFFSTLFLVVLFSIVDTWFIVKGGDLNAG